MQRPARSRSCDIPVVLYGMSYRIARMNNICAGIGRGRMTIINDNIVHRKHVQALYE